jgi:TatD DNase family protein
MLFDSHAHYDDKKFDSDREMILASLPDKGVGYVLNVGCGIKSTQKSIDYTHKYDYFYAAAGIHPHDAAKAPEGFCDALEGFFSDSKVVAVGEIGLDYYYDFSPREVQKEVFRNLLALAVKVGKPVIIHNREAHKDILDIIGEYTGSLCGGVFHCFSGSLEMARIVLKLGFYLSFGGAITFKNARRAIEILEYMPLDRLLIETDCPYMTPEPHRGQRNDSSFVHLVAKKVAEIKNVDLADIISATTDNAKRLFNVTA